MVKVRVKELEEKNGGVCKGKYRFETICNTWDFIQTTDCKIIYYISHLTELNIDVNVRRVVTQRTILPGTISLGTRNDNQATNTKIILGI